MDNGMQASFTTRDYCYENSVETVEERNEYYHFKTQQAKDALDNTMFNEARGDARYVSRSSARLPSNFWRR